MKRSFFLFAFLVATQFSYSQNPFITSIYTADPAAHVWADGRLYVYPSHDIDPARGCDLMDRYHVYSTDDMVTWRDEGELLQASQVSWGRKEGGFMWAPDCAYKNGTYYFYFPHPSGTDWNKTWKIGAATSRKPASDFTPGGYIEGLSGNAMIDPAVFIDTDGQAYFYYGGGSVCQGGKLSHTGQGNLRSLCVDYLHFNNDGTIQLVEQTKAGVAPVGKSVSGRQVAGAKRYEAETASRSGDATVVNGGKASSKKYITGMQGKEASMEFSAVDGGKAGGRATISIHYAAASFARVKLLVNGQDYSLLNALPTGSLQTFTGKTALTVPLRPGKNNIIKVLGGLGAINIDYISVTPVR